MSRVLSMTSFRVAARRLFNFRSSKIDGFRIVCDASRMDFEICRALLRGSYELAERTLARAAIRTGDNVLEIGAGIGIVSLVCAKLAAPGQVTSYEANSTLAPLMRENFSLNGLTPHLISKAVTELGGQIHFF